MIGQIGLGESAPAGNKVNLKPEPLSDNDDEADYLSSLILN